MSNRPPKLTNTVLRPPRPSNQRYAGGERPEPILHHAPANHRLISNMFGIELRKNWQIYEYPINWGGADSTAIRKRLYRSLLSAFMGSDQFNKWQCDLVMNGNNLYSMVVLPGRFPLPYRADLDVRVSSSKSVRYTIELQDPRAIHVSPGIPVSQEHANVFHIILQRCLEGSGMLQRMGKKYCEKTAIEHRGVQHATIFPGWDVEVFSRNYDGGYKLLLTVDAVHRVISTKTCLSVALDIISRNDVPQSHVPNWDGIPKHIKRQLKLQLVGKAVFTVQGQRRHLITNIAFKKSPLSTFWMENKQTRGATEISFLEYFERLKQTQPLAYRNQPLAEMKGLGGKPIYIPLELLNVTDLTTEARRNLPQTCSIRPTERFRRVNALTDLLAGSSKVQEMLNRFGIKISTQPVERPITSLASPTIRIAGQVQPTPTTRNWRNVKPDWSKIPQQHTNFIVTVDPGFDPRQLLSQMKSELQSLRSPLVLKERVIPVDRPEASHVEFIRRLYPDGLPAGPTMVLSMLSGDRHSDRKRKDIKEWTCSPTVGVLSQCVNVGKLSALDPSKRGPIVSNLVKQINHKFGFLSWALDMPASVPSMNGKSIVVIGIDVYHSRKTFEQGEKLFKQARSVVGMVAYCINATGAMKTHCKIVPVKARQEILCSASDETDSDARGTSGSATASADVLEAPEIQASNALFDFTETVLTKFFPQHPPDYLVVHRDGVADSQLEAVRQREVNQLRMTQRKRPAMKLAFYVVQKRISHRFLSKNQAYQYGNPLPGTIVDGGHPDYLDFWLVPSMCTLSTARPTRYVELCRDQGVQLQPMQQLAYSMCYMYYNWTDSVKLPAPTQCAHKIAYLFGEQGMLEPAVHDRLSNYLYFL